VEASGDTRENNNPRLDNIFIVDTFQKNMTDVLDTINSKSDSVEKLVINIDNISKN
jgi:hypothetical protein